MPAKRTWTDDDLRDAVAASSTAAEVVRRLGLVISGNVIPHVGKHVVRLGLDTSHFTGQGWAKGTRKRAADVRATLEPLLRRGTRITALRNRLIAAGLKEARCEHCEITEWQGQPAPLQVDHVDGDRRNNLLENLRILCVNCHALTDTWGFKGGRRRPS